MNYKSYIEELEDYIIMLCQVYRNQDILTHIPLQDRQELRELIEQIYKRRQRSDTESIPSHLN